MNASNIIEKQSGLILRKALPYVLDLSCLIRSAASHYNSKPVARFLTQMALVCSVFTPVAVSRAESIIIPAEYAALEGEDVAGSSTTAGEAFRWQWLYHSFLFPSEHIDITGIRLRPKASTGTFTIEYSNLQLSLTTTNEMSLQPNFGGNLENSLHDTTVLIDADVTVGTANQTPPQNPKDFDYEFSWAATPFRYDPRDGGNLLLDFNARGGVSGPPSLDMSRTGFFNHDGQVLPRTVLFDNLNARFPVVEILYKPVLEPGETLGDFDANGVLEEADLNLLTAEIIGSGANLDYDLNADVTVTKADHYLWVTSLKKTWIGDANLDNQFNASDFVEVLSRGMYEDAEVMNAQWGDGDWNADQEFDSTDLIDALSDGGYERGLRPATAAVPEPSCIVLWMLSFSGFLRLRRRIR